MTKINLSLRMYDHYCLWKSSGVSQSEYSRINDLEFDQFHYWVCKFRKEDTFARKESSGFVPLVVASNGGIPIFEINYANGNRISFHQAVDISFVKALLG
jgi:hypothetical protein